MFEGILKSLQAQTKFVPRSERICLTGPRTARKRLSALMKLDVSRDSITSIWTCEDHRPCLVCERPPLVRREETFQGPNTSNPTFVNGGSVDRRSAGRLDIFWLPSGALSRLHVTPWCMTLLTFLFPPTIHKPAERIAPSVNKRPWCRVCSWCWLISKVAMWCLPGIIKGVFSPWSRLDWLRRPPTLKTHKHQWRGPGFWENCFAVSSPAYGGIWSLRCRLPVVLLEWGCLRLG